MSASSSNSKRPDKPTEPDRGLRAPSPADCNRAFNITRDIRGEARIVERAFGLGASALAEAVQHVSEQFELEAA
jgi:hypothetical protein